VRSRTIFVISLVVLVVLVGFSIFLATRPPAPGATDVVSPLVGHRAPGFTATTLDGATTSLAADTGHVVVLNFWASWCEPCQHEAIPLSVFADQEHPNGVDVLGVVWQDSVGAARTFQQTYGSLYPSVIDPNGTIATSYGVIAPPTTVVIAPNGTVAAVLLGQVTATQLYDAVVEARA
jgi:peroxiredoxin